MPDEITQQEPQNQEIVCVESLPGMAAVEPQKNVKVEHRGLKLLAEREIAAQWFSTCTKDLDPAAPKSQNELAAQLGIRAGTISEWKKDPAFIQRINELVEQRYDLDYAEVAASLTREAVGGDVSAIALWLKWRRKMPQTEQVGVGIGVSITLADAVRATENQGEIPDAEIIDAEPADEPDGDATDRVSA